MDLAESKQRAPDSRKKRRKVSSWIKIIALFASGFIIFRLNVIVCAIFILSMSIFSAVLGLKLKKQLFLQRPAFMYAVALYALHLFEQSFGIFSGNSFSMQSFFVPDTAIAKMMLKIFAALQCVNLLYFTTTQLEIRAGISTIEMAIRRIFPHKNPVRPQFAHCVSLMLTFIPQIFSAWNELERAWKARGGKNGLAKMKKLVPSLISLCMHRAYQTALAVIARNPT